jgi:hypothetical protein
LLLLLIEIHSMGFVSADVSSTSNEPATTTADEHALSSTIEHDNASSISSVDDDRLQSSERTRMTSVKNSNDIDIDIDNDDDKLPPMNNEQQVRVDKRSARGKARSVSFAANVDEYEIPARSSVSYEYRPKEFIDALVESYKLQISSSDVDLARRDEKKYVPKTSRTRLNPNWREHRVRRLMNKLEELTLWDREEELKASQAQFLREQKLEQIQDRQRNHDLCLFLMRQRHESEMESAVLLDRASNSVNDEMTRTSIAQAMKLATSDDGLAYALPKASQAAVKRRARQEHEQTAPMKTPIGRFRQFETTMDHKLDQINEKLQPDRDIMRAYSPYYTTVPGTVVPLFSETYASLLAVPVIDSSNRNQHYQNGAACHVPHVTHASSPDYETRVRAYAMRDVRVPLKDNIHERTYGNDSDNDDDNDHNCRRLTSRTSSSSSQRGDRAMSSPTSTSSFYDRSDSLRDTSLLHCRPSTLNNVHQRTLNDDLNSITRFSMETNRKVRPHRTDALTNSSMNGRSSNKKNLISSMDFAQNDDDDDDDDDNFKYKHLSNVRYPPEIYSISAAR